MLLKWYARAKTWAVNDEGATAVEYGIMVAAIAAVIIAIVILLGEQLNKVFTNVYNSLMGI